MCHTGTSFKTDNAQHFTLKDGNYIVVLEGDKHMSEEIRKSKTKQVLNSEEIKKSKNKQVLMSEEIRKSKNKTRSKSE